MYPLVMLESKSLFLLHNIILCLKMAVLGSAAISQGVKKKEVGEQRRRSETLQCSGSQSWLYNSSPESF